MIDGLDIELREAHKAAADIQGLVEPTEDERRNGWTAETLTEYLASRMAGQSMDADINSMHRRNARRPDAQNHRYNPKRWRG